MTSASSGSGTFQLLSSRTRIGMLVTGDAPAVRLEEQLGALGLVDARVDVLDRRLLLARVAAAQVGDAGRPHLLRRLDRRQQLAARGGPALRQRAQGVGDRRLRELQQEVERERRRQEVTVDSPARSAGGFVARQVHR